MNALIAHVQYDSNNDQYSSKTVTEEIPAILNPAIPRYQHNQARLFIFPDTGANICLAGPEHLHQFNMSKQNLIKCIKRVKTVGGNIITCNGWMPVTFNIFGQTTTQPVYFCEKVDWFYFSKQGCQDTKIIHQNIPYPQTSDLQSDLEKSRVSSVETVMGYQTPICSDRREHSES